MPERDCVCNESAEIARGNPPAGSSGHTLVRGLFNDMAPYYDMIHGIFPWDREAGIAAAAFAALG